MTTLDMKPSAPAFRPLSTGSEWSAETATSKAWDIGRSAGGALGEGARGPQPGRHAPVVPPSAVCHVTAGSGPFPGLA